MLWKGRRESENIEDQRNNAVSSPRLKLSGGALIVVLLVGWALGENPLTLLQLLSDGNVLTNQTGSSTPQINAGNDAEAHLVAVVLADTEDAWAAYCRL